MGNRIQSRQQEEIWLNEIKPDRLLFHNDFDGICSAALLVAFWGVLPKLEPIHYGLKKRWLGLDLSKAAVVDFLFHPDALWWFDHHDTTFVSDQVRQLYIANSRHRWDTTYNSCPPLILDVLSETVDTTALRRRFADWAHWSDIIDAAMYRDPQQAVLGSEPAILINQALSESHDKELSAYMIREISNGVKPKSLAEDDRVNPLWQNWRMRANHALEVMEKRIEIYDTVGYCDIIDLEIPFIRYAIYFFYPNIHFSVLAYRRQFYKASYWISISANPWLERDGEKLNISTIATRYGGGGRSQVGAVSSSSAKECRVISQEISKVLSRTDKGVKEGNQ